jgi:hypothetical protein
MEIEAASTGCDDGVTTGCDDGVEQKADIALLKIPENVLSFVAKEYGYEVLSSKPLYGGYSSSNMQCELKSAGMKLQYLLFMLT